MQGIVQTCRNKSNLSSKASESENERNLNNKKDCTISSPRFYTLLILAFLTEKRQIDS